MARRVAKSSTDDDGDLVRVDRVQNLLSVLRYGQRERLWRLLRLAHEERLALDRLLAARLRCRTLLRLLLLLHLLACRRTAQYSTAQYSTGFRVLRNIS